MAAKLVPTKDLEVDEEYEDEEIDEEQEAQDVEFLQMCVDYEATNKDGEYVGFMSDPFGCKDFRRDTLKKFWPRLLTALLINTVCLYINNVSQAWLQQNISGYYETRYVAVPPAPVNSTVVLWDVIFETLPKVTSTKPADQVATAIPMMFALRFLVLPGPLSLRWTIFCRVWTIWGFLWLGRACTIWTTPLPNPDPTCVPMITYPDNVWLEGWANLPFVFWHTELTCQDVMYSGHTMAMTLPMIAAFRYLPLAPWCQWDGAHKWLSFSTALNLLGYVVLLWGYYLIVGSHFHYTVDVVVGCGVSFMAFFGYHYQIQVSWLAPKRSRWFWARFVRWFEVHSKDLITWRRQAIKDLQDYTKELEEEATFD